MNTLLEKLHLTTPAENPPHEPDTRELQELRDKYKQAGHHHVFHYYDELDVAGKASLFEQLSQIDPKHVNEIRREAVKPSETRHEDAKSMDEDQESKHEDAKPIFEPLPASTSASVLESSEEEIDSWYQYGLEFIAENKVGVVLMAGGQGTRLGSSDPKGCYNIGLPSGKSLFQLQAEKIAKIQELAKHKHGRENVSVPWYIMTSSATRKPTQEFFEKHKYFGLLQENVMLFEQGVLPCISDQGKILLEDKSKVAVAPGGNGGLYQAMVLSPVVSDMRKRGVEHVHAYCVDNCLVRVADPVFIGFAASKQVAVATKVVSKRNAKESVGLILQKDGKPEVVEYSEISSKMAEEKDLKNHDLLRFRAANIVNHYYSFSFLESIPDWVYKLPYHVAHKKIPYLNFNNNEIVKPEKPNGIKLEQFVFDCFPFVPMDKFGCLEVKREDEYSPLKNGKDSKGDNPDTSRRDVLAQGARWLTAAGAVVISETDDSGVEVSPLISYGGEGLQGFQGKEVKAPAVIERDVA